MGRASSRMLSRGRTSAEPLRDLRNTRREEDKWNNTFPGWPRAKICRCSVLYGQKAISTAWRERIKGSFSPGPSYREQKKRHNSNESIASGGCLWRLAISSSTGHQHAGTSTGKGPGSSKGARTGTFLGTDAGGSSLGILAGGGNAGGTAGK